MIVQEFIDDHTVRTYSDKGMYIYGGFPIGYYAEAIDPINKHRKYKETNTPIVINKESIQEHEPKTNHLHIEEDRLRAEKAHQIKDE